MYHTQQLEKHDSILQFDFWTNLLVSCSHVYNLLKNVYSYTSFRSFGKMEIKLLQFSGIYLVYTVHNVFILLNFELNF